MHVYRSIDVLIYILHYDTLRANYYNYSSKHEVELTQRLPAYRYSYRTCSI